MYTQTKSQILEIISKKNEISVKELITILGITQAAIHRQLNQLLYEKKITKIGKPPRVYYKLTTTDLQTDFFIKLSDDKIKIMNESYIYINPIGEIKTGPLGFLEWMRNTLNKQKPENCVDDYIEILSEANTHKDSELNLINATKRLKNILPTLHSDEIYYHDFYSLIKFGKTKLGQYLLHGKQAQNKQIIQLIAGIVKPSILKLIKNKKIDAIAWAPHSIPRKIPFLKELEKNLALNLNKIEIVKAYQGSIPIAQKSLSKLEERIKNARETLIVTSSKITAKNILLIDDAVGSGATINELAFKLKAAGAKRVISYAIVGSYKGFEVIKEV